ncbi:hypothetical protein OSB04_022315 [Centaurea solstitialis]|uniref:PB1 domain-containing protein n=1 Tax=Centaurea solstitialis TaxID=347529 RepID=A0AA38W5T9_9ASTR|nr:hypothetical protein OSB04_022315 [Centaurea solstitialis]
MAGTTPKPSTVKFLCSYGGKILPRYTDGKLRYCGGETRVISVNRSLSFSELLEKLGEICRTPAVALRCQLPTEDLDALVSITCDEDLVNLIEEYDRKSSVQSSSNLKIRAFLTLAKKSSSIPSRRSAYGFSSSTSIDLEIPSSPRSPSSSSSYSSSTARFPIAGKSHCIQQVSRKHPLRSDRSAGKLLRYACENSSQSYLVHNGNHWQ